MLMVTVPSIIGGVVYGVLFLVLAGFVFMQRGKSPKLARLLLVAIGLGLLGLSFLLAVPIELVKGMLSYGTLYDVVRVVDRVVAATGLLGGIAGIVVGSTLTAVGLAEDAA